MDNLEIARTEMGFNLSEQVMFPGCFVKIFRDELWDIVLEVARGL